MKINNINITPCLALPRFEYLLVVSCRFLLLSNKIHEEKSIGLKGNRQLRAYSIRFYDLMTIDRKIRPPQIRKNWKI